MPEPSAADAPVRLVTPRGRGWAVEEYGADRLRTLIAADNCPDPAAVVQKRGNTALVLRGELILPGAAGTAPTGRPAAVCWKRIRRKTWAKRLATTVRTRRTVLTYAHAGRLRAAGVETPRPLACTAPPWYRIDRPGWLVTEWLDGTEDLAVASRRLAELAPGDRLRIAGRYAAAVGRTLGLLHAAGASHRDLKPNNVLVTRLAGSQSAGIEPVGGQEEAVDAVRAWVIDLDAVSFPRRLSNARRRKDLARLRRGLPDVPRTAIARFFRAYAVASGADGRAEWRALPPHG